MAYIFSRKRKLAAFFALTLFILFSVSIIFILTQKNFFQKKVYYVCILKTSGFLKKGNEVIMNGFTIGNIRTVKLAENDLVMVRFFVYEKYRSYIRQNIRIFPLKSFSKSMLIIEAPKNNDSHEVMENSILYGIQNQNIDYSMYSAVDANTSIDTLAFNIDNMAKGFINPDYGVKAIYSNIYILRNYITNKDYLLVNDILTNKQILRNIEKIIKYATNTIRNTEQLSGDISKISALYTKKRKNIENIQNNLNYTYVSLQKLITEISSNDTYLKELSDTFTSLSNSVANEKGKK